MKSARVGDRAPGAPPAPPVSGDGPVAAGQGPAATGGPHALGDDWAVCCSGGGIRSAAYCLGALQGLDEGGLLAKTKWILGVSGGSYIAASRALVAHNLPADAKQHAYASGTPEERNLRYNTHYIAPNGATVLVGILSLLLGSMVTFIVVLAPLYALAHAWGWLLRSQGAVVPSGPHTMTAAVTGLACWLPSVIAAGITLALFAYWWLRLEPPHHPDRPARWWEVLTPDDPDAGASRASLVAWSATLTAGLALAMLAVPPVISWLTHSNGSLGTIAHFAGFGARPTWSLAAVGGLIAAVAGVARFCQAGLAKWNALSSPAQAQAQATGAAQQPGLAARLAGRLRQQLLPWLASAVIVLGGVVLVLLWISDGARAGFGRGQLLLVIAALGVALLTRIVANVNRLSMHDFYRWRLADAYAVTRPAAEAQQRQDPVLARKLFAEAAATRLSDLREVHATGDEPALVICATANINAARQVPPGQGGFCVTFDSEHVTLHQEQTLASEGARARTSDYEALVGQRRCTLFDVSAISGAAISPLMGSMTRHAHRILFTATNLRLGVWLPHPGLIRAAREHIDRAAGGADRWWVRHPLLLLLWYQLPHLFWYGDQKKNSDREAALWAHVLTRRISGGRRGVLWYRAMQPTLALLRSEAVGHTSYRGTWMYVTDGGHYDNLGLVEALRRGASHIVVLDASGDKADTWFTLGGAIALARADAGVNVTLDPTTMIHGGQGLAPGQVVRPWVHGWFRRPEKVPGLPQQGEIWVCKLGWWAEAPWDVLAYARHNSTYPCDSTLDQLYDATEFEAYHQLGVATVLDAAKRCEPPLEWVSPDLAQETGGVFSPAGR